MKAMLLALEDVSARSYGGTLRTRAMASTLRHLGHDVTVLAPPGQTTPGTRLSRTSLGQLKRRFLPMPTMAGARSASLDEVFSKPLDADLLVCQVFQQARYLAPARGPIRWLDFSDLYSEFGRRESTERHGLPRLTAGLQARLIGAQEVRHARRADIVTAAGYGDALLLRERGLRVTWLPTPVIGQAISPPRGEHLRVGFIGHFDYWPNVAAYNVLVDTWLPTWAHQVQLVVAGHGTDRLKRVDEVQMLGAVANVSEFYREVDVVLAPVNRGSGMKVKVAEALVYGRPVVATPAALDGFPPEIRALCTQVNAGTVPSVSMILDAARREPARQALKALEHDAFKTEVARLIGEASITRQTASP